MSIQVCWLDMDGVLVDFVGGALKVHGVPDLFDHPASKGVWDIEKLLGISSNQFWSKINALPTFWEDLAPTPEAAAIVELVEGRFGEENVGILTAPATGDECFIGKRRWLRTHFPQFISRLAYAKDKALYASPRHLLIDDKESNVEEFREAGGARILVPRAWNTLWRVEDVMGEIEEGLIQLEGF